MVAQLTLPFAKQFKTRLTALNLDKTLPVGTADAGAQISPALVAGVD